MRGLEKDYMSEMSRYLAEQIKREMQDMHAKFEDSIEDVKKETKGMKQTVISYNKFKLNSL